MTLLPRQSYEWLGPEHQRGQVGRFPDPEFYDLGPVMSIEGERRVVIWSCGRRGFQEDTGRLRFVVTADEHREAFPDGRLPLGVPTDTWERAGERGWFELRIDDAPPGSEAVAIHSGLDSVVMLALEAAGSAMPIRSHALEGQVRSIAEAMNRR